jgi:hypothetical protein
MVSRSSGMDAVSPTTGLHFDAMRKLLNVINGLVRQRQYGHCHRTQPGKVSA